MSFEKFKQACENQPEDPDQAKRLKRMQDMKMKDIKFAKDQFKKIEEFKKKSDKKIERLQRRLNK